MNAHDRARRLLCRLLCRTRRPQCEELMLIEVKTDRGYGISWVDVRPIGRF